MKEITKDEFYDYSKYKILDNRKIYLPKPKIGKIYRDPNVTLLKGEKKVIEIIRIDTKKSSLFRYEYSPMITRLHTRKYKIYIKYESE